jgi:hypothetical protein
MPGRRGSLRRWRRPTRRKLRQTGWALLTVVFVGVATTGARGSFGLFIEPWDYTTFFIAAAVALFTASAVSLTLRGTRPLVPATA